ncbi:MAG: hypothetical protein DRN12_08235 [Thermoplasmata archaeon]|nr:MAG: hypothetical protein DRN12_08235 [Thermoplasmata archaeon]
MRGLNINVMMVISVMVLLLSGTSTIGLISRQKLSGDTCEYSNENYNYVIITLPEFESALASFRTWKESIGYSVKVVTTSWIYSHYTGRDLEEKIRNFLIDKYNEWKINYVLIVGSRDKIPMRLCYPLPSHEGYDPTPTDYYYADLTGDWDSDKDGYFGEYQQDNVDFCPEIYVGRIPADNVDKIQNICRNIINFESDNGAWKKNVLLLAAIIFYENQTMVGYKWHRSDGATLMEKCRNDIFEPNGFNSTSMYEKEGIRPSIYKYDYPINHSNVLSEWKKGYGIVNMLGHASNLQIGRLVWNYDDGNNVPEYPEEVEYIDFLQYADGRSLTTEKPPIVFTSGCYQLWSSTNMGRYFMENGAAVAFIGSTGGSWYNISLIWNDERDGGTYSINYYFFYYLINRDQKCGNALYNSKVYYYNHFMFTENKPEWIFRCYDNLYGFNLYGDPSLGIAANEDNNPPTVIIEKPRGHLYLLDREILPTLFGRAIIFGDISIEINATDKETGIEKVEIWIDDKLKYTATEKPYKWIWNEFAIGKHLLKAVAEDRVGNMAYYEVEAWIFNI